MECRKLKGKGCPQGGKIGGGRRKFLDQKHSPDVIVQTIELLEVLNVLEIYNTEVRRFRRC